MAQVGDAIGSADDPIRNYTEDEERRLTVNLKSLAQDVRSGVFHPQPLANRLIQALHVRLFHGVRDHAGKTRSPGFGAEHLMFGPNRSLNKKDVPAALEHAFEKARKSERSLLDNQGAPEFERSAVYLAVWLHAEVIRIHPFEDGNGRTARLVMSEVLVRLGLEPIPVEAHKAEYCAALNHYIETEKGGAGDLGQLIDLFLRIAEDLLEE